MDDEHQSNNIDKLREAWSLLFYEIVKALRIDKFVVWLSVKLERFQ